MTTLHVHIVDENDKEEINAIGITMVMSLIYADKNFKAFADEFSLPEKDREEMQNDLREIIAVGLRAERDSLTVLLSIWGKDKTMDYIEELTGKKMEGRE